MAGHDLTIEVTRWDGPVQVESPEGPRGRIDVRVDARSLEVREGRGGAKPLTDKDRREIKSTLESKVLQTPAHPQILFHADRVSGFSETGASAGATLEGSLEINGRTEPASVRVDLEREQGRLHARGGATVQQTRWGIRPYTAFLGALRVADEVEVSFDLDLPLEPG